jgi:hypothetical protein
LILFFTPFSHYNIYPFSSNNSGQAAAGPRDFLLTAFDSCQQSESWQIFRILAKHPFCCSFLGRVRFFPRGKLNIQMYIRSCLAGWPDWANFRLFGSYLWTVFLNYGSTYVCSTNSWGYFFAVEVLTTNGLGHVLGISWIHLVTLLYTTNEKSHRQGDQIGRIFARWVTLYFGSFCENYWRSISP